MRAASHRRILLLALTLLVVALLPRLFGLGDLGFYGDEETTAFPARSLAAGEGPRMPTGMLYLRGILLTLLNAVSVAILGADAELAYRLPAALLGAVSAPLLFLWTRRTWGLPVAALAALLLALSEWHVAMSREARMYAPFVLCFLATGLFAERHAAEPRRGRLAAAVAAFVIGLGFHTLGRTGAALFAIPLGTGASPAIAWRMARLSLVLVTLGQFLSQCGILAPYRTWTLEAAEAGHTGVWCGPAELVRLFAPLSVVLLAMWGLQRTVGTERLVSLVRRAATIGAGLGLVAAVAAGQLYLALLLLVAWIAIEPAAPVRVARRRPWLLVAIAVLGAAHVGLGVTQHGLEEGIKQTLRFPFAYLLYFHELAGALGVLFVGVVLWMGLRPERADAPLRFAVLAAWLPIFVAGIGSQWNGRYLAGALPFMCLVVARGLLDIVEELAGRLGVAAPRRVAVGAVLALALAMPLGIGVWPAARAATVGYGDPLSQLIYAHPTYPDHQSTGRWVADRRCLDDVVIAEDSLQARWYAGPVDVWLRDPETHETWIYRGEDGTLRDVYVDSALPSFETLEALPRTTRGNVWLITTAESYGHWDYGLDARRLAWLRRILDEETPLYTGRDGTSFVFCLNCPDGEPRRCDAPN